MRENGNVLTELEVLRTLYAEYSASGPLAKEMMATLLMEKTAELGNYAEALMYADIGTNGIKSEGPSAMLELETFEPVDALEAMPNFR